MLFDFLMQHFSYGVLFAWSLMEGEIGLALAGYKVQLGQLRPEYVLAIAISGAIIGDFTIFMIGRLFKSKTEIMLRQHQKRLEHIEEWFRNYGSWIIVFERFIYGTHIPALLMIGASGFSFLKFLLLDIVGVVLWAVTFTTVGFVFGQAVIDILTVVQRHLTIVILVAFFLFVIYQLHIVDKEAEAE